MIVYFYLPSHAYRLTPSRIPVSDCLFGSVFCSCSSSCVYTYSECIIMNEPDIREKTIHSGLAAEWLLDFLLHSVSIFIHTEYRKIHSGGVFHFMNYNVSRCSFAFSSRYYFFWCSVIDWMSVTVAVCGLAWLYNV